MTNGKTWIDWNGGRDAPVDGNTMVLVMFRFKRTLGSAIKPADRYTWPHTGGGADIIAYQVRGVAVNAVAAPTMPQEPPKSGHLAATS